MQHFWDTCKKELERHIDPHNFISHIEPITISAITDNEVTLMVSSAFSQGWIERNHLRDITEAVNRNAGGERKICFIVSAAQAKEARTPIPVKTKQRKAAAPIRLNPLYTFPSFVRGKSNEFAFASSMQAALNPGTKYNPLYLYGGVGLGKTHLLQSISRFILDKHPDWNVLYLSSDQFVTQMISRMQKGQMEEFRNTFRNLDVLLIDDIQFIAGKPATQEEFFHTFNELFHAGKQIVITSDQFPKDIKKLEDRLRSRFASGLIADIQPPDLETKIAIIRTKAEINGYKLPEDVIHFLAETIKSNIRELEGCMARVVAFSSLKGVPIDIVLARDVLHDVYSNAQKHIGIPQIQKTVTEYFGLKPNDLKSKNRSRNLAVPRQIAMYLCREITDESLPQIGKVFGGRDHSTVIHAHQKIKKEVETNTKIYSDITAVKKMLEL